MWPVLLTKPRVIACQGDRIAPGHGCGASTVDSPIAHGEFPVGVCRRSGGAGAWPAVSISLLEKGIQFPGDTPVPSPFVLDGRALLFSITVALISLVLFGLVPALQTTRTDLNTALKKAAAPWPLHPGRRLPGEQALGPELVGHVPGGRLAGSIHDCELRVRSDARHILVRGPGFRTDHILGMSLDPGLLHYSDTQTKQFYRQLIESVRSVTWRKVGGARVQAGAKPRSCRRDFNFRPARTVLFSLIADWVDESFFNTLAIPDSQRSRLPRYGLGERPRRGCSDPDNRPGLLARAESHRQTFSAGQPQRAVGRDGGRGQAQQLSTFPTSPVDFVYFPYTQTSRPCPLMLLAQNPATQPGWPDLCAKWSASWTQISRF